ncbi:spore coat protein [Psychrobacillus sp. INOP01]|uniref:spore coat protein n=1 Tax=Psychrobacillus sp. INOP01 TaxID=2829187 RepID=UPI001BA748ED|nr:spore coat protein [Psychrobacillus sp. INOP01]QUG41551.1 spore coat protein [Psychrobacillus sp. INOP01]
MSNLPEKPNAISNKVIDLLVDDTLRRNGIDPENIKQKLSDQQKKQLKELVEDLTQQVNTFTDQPTTDKKNSK